MSNTGFETTNGAPATVAGAMHEGVFTCPPEAPLRTVAAMMAEHRIHCVVVFGGADGSEGAPVWGVVSDLDLVASTADLSVRAAATAAATPAVTIAPDEPLGRAAQLMTEYGTAHLVVVDPATTRPTGVISTLDVARALSREPEFAYRP
jgi:CBS-domain-containing membrane protein